MIFGRPEPARSHRGLRRRIPGTTAPPVQGGQPDGPNVNPPPPAKGYCENPAPMFGRWLTHLMSDGSTIGILVVPGPSPPSPAESAAAANPQTSKPRKSASSHAHSSRRRVRRGSSSNAFNAARKEYEASLKKLRDPLQRRHGDKMRIQWIRTGVDGLPLAAQAVLQPGRAGRAAAGAGSEGRTSARRTISYKQAMEYKNKGSRQRIRSQPAAGRTAPPGNSGQVPQAATKSQTWPTQLGEIYESKAYKQYDRARRSITSARSSG